ncbi:hypothetical protein F0365_13850 [Nonlabens sp. Ci31]|uniref:hypothetical protein n=1 Tax=Nonlabens sp. Ci31 TaxID=2608253 RepID=UPI0014628A34|nr:hypothetical protein [Nonlabens sp. Ci31]QJP35404.1 hypothetical protein F0365_13850 [Nonlabens sp. Ci31]
MKNIITIFAILIFGTIYSQTDQNGNPVFNSIITSEQVFDEYDLVSNYYTLENNIENKNSSVYISENPTLDKVEKFATELPSDFFLITKNQQMLNMILIISKPKMTFVVMDMATNKQSEYNFKLRGDITENRANEIIKINYDTDAEIKRGKLYFNNKKFRIISNADINRAVLSLINKEELGKSNSSEVKILSQEELKKIILIETKEGGKLDYFTEIKGQEYDGIQIKPGVFSTKLGMALYQWGRANFENGVNTLEDAYKIFSEFKERELNQREKEYIKLGFNKELEK